MHHGPPHHERRLFTHTHERNSRIATARAAEFDFTSLLACLPSTQLFRPAASQIPGARERRYADADATICAFHHRAAMPTQMVISRLQVIPRGRGHSMAASPTAAHMTRHFAIFGRCRRRRRCRLFDATEPIIGSTTCFTPVSRARPTRACCSAF